MHGARGSAVYRRPASFSMNSAIALFTTVGFSSGAKMASIGNIEPGAVGNRIGNRAHFVDGRNGVVLPNHDERWNIDRRQQRPRIDPHGHALECGRDTLR